MLFCARRKFEDRSVVVVATGVCWAPPSERAFFLFACLVGLCWGFCLQRGACLLPATTPTVFVYICVCVCVRARPGLFVAVEFRWCFLPALFPYFAFVRGLVVVLMAVFRCFRV
jgi:hypothetical protein